MKKIFFILFSLIFVISGVFAYTIQTGVSVDKIPKTLFGSWQVESKLVETNSAITFKTGGMDLWNLSRYGNVLKLENPFTGAKAEVNVKSAEGNVVVFSKTSDWDNKVLTDIVSIRINNDRFSGINDVILETHSLYDGHVLKKETARYRVNGKKLSGNTLLR